MYYIVLDVHKKTISFCVKDAAGCVQQECKIGSTWRELDAWVRTLPQPRTIAIFIVYLSLFLRIPSLRYCMELPLATRSQEVPA